MQSDELLLFSTDYPHWQFEAMRFASGVGRSCAQVMIDNLHATYTWLNQSALKETTSRTCSSATVPNRRRPSA
jgi:hypothetical protein